MTMNIGGDGPSDSTVSPGDASAFGRSYLWTGLALLLVLALGLGAIMWFRFGPGKSGDPGDARDPAVANAVRALRSGNPADRVTAIRQVAQLGLDDSGRSIPPVIQALEDADAAVRAQAAESLGVLGSYAVWARSAGVKKESGDEAPVGAATSALLGSLAKDEQPTVRAAAAGGLRTISATSPEASKSRGHSKQAGGEGSAEAAAPLPPLVDYKVVVATLIAALGDRDERVRSAAATALAAAGPRVSGEPPEPLVAALTDQSIPVQAAAAIAVTSFSRGLDPVLPTLIRVAERADPRVQEACARALGQTKRSAISAAALPALVAGLRNPDREIRLQVVALIARLGPEARGAIPALIATLKDPAGLDRASYTGRAFVRTFVGPAQEAARVLGAIAPGTPSESEAIAALTEVVRAGPPQRRSAAAEALAEFGPKAVAAVPDLIEMLKQTDAIKPDAPSRDGEVVAKTLARIAPGTPSVDSVVAALRAALGSQSKMTRSAAISALQRFGTKAASAIPQLQALKKDPDSSVSKAASEALETLEGH